MSLIVVQSCYDLISFVALVAYVIPYYLLFRYFVHQCTVNRFTGLIIQLKSGNV